VPVTLTQYTIFHHKRNNSGKCSWPANDIRLSLIGVILHQTVLQVINIYGSGTTNPTFLDLIGPIWTTSKWFFPDVYWWSYKIEACTCQSATVP